MQTFRHTNMIKKILKADIDFLHLTLRAIAFAGINFTVMFILFPLNFMLMFGEGVSADRLGNTILVKILWLLSGCIILAPFALYRISVNIKKNNLSKAKDYVIIIILTLILSIAFYRWYNTSTTS